MDSSFAFKNCIVTDENTASVKSKLIYLTSVGTREVIAKNDLTKTDEGLWKIRYNAPSKAFSQELISAQSTPTFRDMTAARLLTPADPVQRLARPRVEILSAEFIERAGRMYIGGRIRNLSQFPVLELIAFFRAKIPHSVLTSKAT